MHEIDLLRTHLGFNDEFCVRRQNFRHHLAGRNDAAGGVIVQFHNHAVDRRADDVARQHAPGRGQPLLGVRQIGRGLAVEFGAIRDHFRMQMREFVLGLQDALLGAANLGQKLADVALRLGLGAAQLQHARTFREALVEQTSRGLGFLGQELQLRYRGRLLGVQTDDLLLNGLDLALVDIALAFEFGLPRREQGFLRRNALGHFRIARHGFQLPGKGDFRFAIALGVEAGLSRKQRRLLDGQALIVGVRIGVVEFDHGLAIGDLVAFVDQDLGDDAAFQMLHDLVLTGGDEAAMRDDSAGQGSRGCP